MKENENKKQGYDKNNKKQSDLAWGQLAKVETKFRSTITLTNTWFPDFINQTSAASKLHKFDLSWVKYLFEIMEWYVEIQFNINKLQTGSFHTLTLQSHEQKFFNLK